MDPTCAPLARLIAAIEAGDVEAARACYHPDVVVWHNDGSPVQTRDENIAVLGFLVRHVPGLRYVEVRRQPTPTGCVQQHVLEAPVAGRAEPLRIDGCLVVAVDAEGRITRLDEYLDGGQVEPLRAHLVAQRGAGR